MLTLLYYQPGRNSAVLSSVYVLFGQIPTASAVSNARTPSIESSLLGFKIIGT